MSSKISRFCRSTQYIVIILKKKLNLLQVTTIQLLFQDNLLFFDKNNYLIEFIHTQERYTTWPRDTSPFSVDFFYLMFIDLTHATYYTQHSCSWNFKEKIMIGTIILVLLVLFLIGALPTWGHSRSWGYGPTGLIGTILVIYLILVLIGRVPLGF